METPFAAYTGDQAYAFVCYAHDDSDIVYPEITWLRDQGVNLWYDEGISAGTNWRTAIGVSLLAASHVLFYVSAGSLKSDHCNREINLALDEGKDVVPVYLEEVELTTDLKVGLNRVHALHRDQDASYQQHLLNALGQSSTPLEPKLRAVLEEPRTRFSPRIGVGLALVVLIGAVWWFWPRTIEIQTPVAVNSGTPATDGAAVSPTSIAVLPFRAIGSKLQTQATADGFAEAIAAELSGPGLEPIRRLYPILVEDQLNVVPYTSVQQYRDSELDIKDIGRALRVTYVLDGSLRTTGDQHTISVHLIRVADGTSVWSDVYKLNVATRLDTESRLLRQIAAGATISLPEDLWHTSIRKDFADPQAHKYFVIAHGRREEDDLISQVANYEKSLQLDPNFVFTYVYLISSYFRLLEASLQPADTAARLDVLINQFEELLASSADSKWYVWLTEQFFYTKSRLALERLDFESSERFARQSLKTNPNSLGARVLLGQLAIFRGKPADALAIYRRVMDVGGGGAGSIVRSYANLLRVTGQPLAALELIEDSLPLIEGQRRRSLLLLEKARGQIDLELRQEISNTIDEAWSLYGSVNPVMFADVFAQTGRSGQALEILEAAEHAGQDRLIRPTEMIKGYAALDQLDSAFLWIQRSIAADHADTIQFLRMPGIQRLLREDPRWLEVESQLPAFL